jgi:hypothetical protein
MRDMGVATSATTFGRSLGGAIGAAMFGAILTTRLGIYLTDELGSAAGGATAGGEVNTNNVQAIQSLPELIKTEVLTAYTHAITDVFLLAIPVIFLALVAVFFLKEIPLRSGKVRASSKPSASESEVEANMPAFTGH